MKYQIEIRTIKDFLNDNIYLTNATSFTSSSQKVD